MIITNEFAFVIEVTILSCDGLVVITTEFAIIIEVVRLPCDVIREVKHDVYGRRQTAKITSDFLFFSCNP